MKTYKLKNKILNVSVVLIVSILIGIGIQSCNEESVIIPKIGFNFPDDK